MGFWNFHSSIKLEWARNPEKQVNPDWQKETSCLACNFSTTDKTRQDTAVRYSYVKWVGFYLSIVLLISLLFSVAFFFFFFSLKKEACPCFMEIKLIFKRKVLHRASLSNTVQCAFRRSLYLNSWKCNVSSIPRKTGNFFINRFGYVWNLLGNYVSI